MGLLDGVMSGLQSDEGLLGLYLLAAGAAKPQRTSLGEGLLGGMQLVQQQQRQRKADATAEEERKQKALYQAAQMRLLDAQVGETQAQAEERKSNAAKAALALARQTQFQNALGAPTTPQQALSGGGGPTPGNAALIGQRKAPDWQALALQFPDQIDAIKKLAESNNFGRQEVGRVEETMVDGRPVRQQFDKFGAPVGSALPMWKAPEKVDTGGRVQFMDPVTLAVLGGLDKTQTPDSKASNAVAWANNAVSRERLNFDRTQADKPVWDPERGIIVNPRSGEAQPAMLNGAPVGAKDKGMNDTQAKALLFGTRMMEADKVLSTLAAAGTSRPSVIKQGAESVPLIGGVLGTAANAAFASPAQQQVEQAQRDFINAVLRRESGAAIADSEFESARRQYFPQVGDSQPVIQQKAANRALAVRAIMAEVPEGKRTIPPAPGAAPAPGAPRIVNFGDLQ